MPNDGLLYQTDFSTTKYCIMSLWHFNKCGRIWEKICFRSNWVVSPKFPVTLIPSEPTFTCSKLIIENARKRCEICSKLTIKKNTRTTFLNFEKPANRQILTRESKIIVPTFCCCYGYGCSVKLINSHTFSFFFFSTEQFLVSWCLCCFLESIYI